MFTKYFMFARGAATKFKQVPAKESTADNASFDVNNEHDRKELLSIFSNQAVEVPWWVESRKDDISFPEWHTAFIISDKVTNKEGVYKSTTLLYPQELAKLQKTLEESGIYGCRFENSSSMVDEELTNTTELLKCPYPKEYIQRFVFPKP